MSSVTGCVIDVAAMMRDFCALKARVAALESKVENFTSTNNARDEICPTCGGHGHVWSAFNEILYCRKCNGTGKLSPVA